MSPQRNIIDFGRSRRAIEIQRSITLPQLVISAQRTVKHQLRELLPAFFANIDNSLYDMADKAESNQEQNLYFDAMRDIRMQKEAMQQAYFDTLSTSFRSSLTQATKKSGSTGQLGLMDDDELEESLAITNMVSNAEAECKEALFGLTTRFDFLIEEIEITNNNNPLRPEILFEAFTSAVQLMDADLKVRLVVYKLFDKYVAQKIGLIYDSINEDLIASGVLPRLKSTINRSAEDLTDSQATTAEGIAVNEISPEEAASMQAMLAMDPTQSDNTFSSLQHLLSFSRATPAKGSMPDHAAVESVATTTAAPSATSSGGTIFAPQQVLTALSQIQSNSESLLQLAQSQQQPSANIIKETVLQAMAEAQDSEGKEISQSEKDAIEIVSMLFDFILDDPSLSDSIKVPISRLQIPLLKVAIIDKEFFAKKDHPARQLLNELAYSGSGLDIVDAEDDAVLQKINQIVDTVLNEFEDNTELFARLHDEFAAFINQQRETNKHAREKLENAKTIVANEIRHRIADHKVPSLISGILINAWKEVLIRLYMRDGMEGAGWNTAIQVADDLIWSVQPKLAVSERQRLVKIIPKVLNGLRDGLTLIQYDHQATENLFAGLEELHLASLRGGVSSVARNSQPATHIDAEDFGADISEMPEQADKATAPENDSFIDEVILASTQALPWEDAKLNASEFADDIRDMALGTWVEFINAETESRYRGKLAWKCDFTGEYTFVDRKYKVVADLSNRQLIEEFELGRAGFVEDVPLFDRALDSVISGIKRALDNKSSDTAEPVLQ